jgi:hypothetical protein
MGNLTTGQALSRTPYGRLGDFEMIPIDEPAAALVVRRSWPGAMRK